MPALRIAAPPALLVAVALLTGCAAQATTAVPAMPDVTSASPGPLESAAPAPSVTGQAAPTQATIAPDAASGGDPVSTVPNASTADPMATPACSGDRLDIRVERRPEASGAGQTYSEIILTNTSDVTCTLSGTPSIVTFLDPSTGQKVGVRGTDRLTGEVVALAPGEAGYAVIHFSSTGAHDCPAISTADARIAPPQWDQSRPVTLDYAVSLCTDRSNYDVSGVSATSLGR
jgi:hypothetical protein